MRGIRTRWLHSADVADMLKTTKVREARRNMIACITPPDIEPHDFDEKCGVRFLSCKGLFKIVDQLIPSHLTKI